MGTGVRRNFTPRPAFAFDQNRHFFHRDEKRHFFDREENRRFFDRDHRVFFQQSFWPVYWYPYGYPYDYSYWIMGRITNIGTIRPRLSNRNPPNLPLNIQLL